MTPRLANDNDVELGDGIRKCDGIQKVSSKPAAAREQAPSTPKRKSRRHLVVAGIALVAGLGLVVALVVVLVQRNRPQETQVEPLPPSTLGEYNKLFVDNVCMSSGDMSTCQHVCQPAACCDPWAKNSCLSTHLEECLAYSKCHVVLQEEKVELAPIHLSSLCQQEDKRKCREACEPAECCFSQDSCTSSQFLTCLDYAPCQVLQQEQVNEAQVSQLPKVPPAPDDLLELCELERTTSTRSVHNCRNSCQAASCCWAEDEDTNCLQSDFMTCLTYAPCLEFPTLPSQWMEKPMEHVEVMCDSDTILRERAYKDCNVLCSLGDCCTDPTQNCFQDDPFTCLLYDRCHLLKLAGGSLVRAPSDINEKCNLDTMDNDTLNECRNICAPASCCFTEDDTNCRDDGNELACREYEICQPIHALGEPLQEPPSILSQVCNEASLKTVAGYSACAKLCQPATCCATSGPESCMLGNIITCGNWNIGGCYLLSN